MQEPERPLGLGILGVVSFAAAMWNLQSAVPLILLVTGHLRMPEQPGMAAGYFALPEWFRYFLLVAAIVKAALLIAAAIGYFMRKRLGRWAGSGYAVLSIVESATAASVVGVFGRESLIGVLFAVYTLIAVNTMYRDVLRR
jgi:hypothetical protein